MTLPFRRRHHDSEGAHDRARTLTAHEMLEALGPDESAWLARHLDACAECRRDREAYLADRELLRGLRERTPEPPRDLWARTAAALDREARRHAGAPSRGERDRPGLERPGRIGWRALPLSAAAGALIVLVVIGTVVIPRPVPPGQTPGASSVAVASPVAPTPIALPDANPVGWIRTASDGSWELVLTDVPAVCPRSEPECRPFLESGQARPVNLGTMPSKVTMSPSDTNLVVESPGDASHPDDSRILVVPVPAPGSTPTPATPPPPTAGPPTGDPSSPDPANPTPSPDTTPSGAVVIASGVTVVGEVAYSRDGQWVAFSARPSDGSTGPDLYLWTAGAAEAQPVTDDHQTYFSAWLNGQVLASRIHVPAASGEPGPTAPAAGEPMEAHATSFLLDPATLARTDLAQADVWLPVVDRAGRFVAYWSGTLRSTDGLEWVLGTGQLVLDRWSSGGAGPQATPGASTDAGASGEPAATTELAIGPAGTPTPIVPGETGAFKARFDPEGTRLAVWVGEQAGDTVGRLHLVVVDPETGVIEPESPLPGVPALGRFSIDVGRLAWVSPRGQDGQDSTVQVLGWSDDDFGEIQTIPARDLYIVR